MPFAAGLVCLAAGLWFFHRSHADLGTNWSLTLEVREKHQLVTGGIYRRVRHPMYMALFLYSVGQALGAAELCGGPVVPRGHRLCCSPSASAPRSG